MTVDNATLEAREEAISSLGFDLEKIVERLGSRVVPPVVSIQKSAEYVTEELGLDKKVFEKEPTLFNYSVDDNLRPKVDYITEELGLDKKVFEKSPSLFRKSVNGNLRPKVAYITEELGLPTKIFEKFPALFNYSVDDNLRPKVAYITEELGLPTKIFEKFPALFGYSLNGRIKPRTAFLQSKGRNISLRSYIIPGDEVFCHKYAKCELSEYQTFKKQYIAANKK